MDKEKDFIDPAPEENVTEAAPETVLSQAGGSPQAEENLQQEEFGEFKGQIKDLKDLNDLLAAEQEEEAEYLRRREERKKTTDESRKKSNLVSEILGWVIPIGIALAISLFLKNYIIINARVPSGSMENTIMTGDNLLGYRLAYKNADPQRGDIVIFYFPDNEEKKYIKRIIGLPGETVVIEDGKIYINGSDTPLEEDYLKEEWVNYTGPYEFQVPEDSYLMLGDNRNNSADARLWVNTYVKREKIIGKALFVYFPFSHIGSLTDK